MKALVLVILLSTSISAESLEVFPFSESCLQRYDDQTEILKTKNDTTKTNNNSNRDLIRGKSIEPFPILSYDADA